MIRLSIALFLFIPTLSFAASAPKELNEAELSAALHRYKGIQELSVDFKQEKTISGLSTRLRSEGSLRMSRPKLLVWTIKKPSFVEVEMMGSLVKITSGEGSDRTVQEFKPSQSESDPQSRSLRALAAWLNWDPPALVKDYKVSATSPQNYLFVPRDPKMTPFTSMELVLAADGRVKQTVVHESSGDRLDITFAEPKIKKGTP